MDRNGRMGVLSQVSAVGSSQAGSQCVVSLRVVATLSSVSSCTSRFHPCGSFSGFPYERSSIAPFRFFPRFRVAGRSSPVPTIEPVASLTRVCISIAVSIVFAITRTVAVLAVTVAIVNVCGELTVNL